MSELDDLLQQLRGERAHVLATVDGLSEEDLTTAWVASGWTPAGLVSHLALDVERFWFREILNGVEVDPEGEPESAWLVEEGNGLAALERYREEARLADEALEGHDVLDGLAAWPEEWSDWRMENLRELMLHVITETATHAGHLDIVREMIDGTQHLVID